MTANSVIIATVLSLSLVQSAFAQQGPLVSERPSFSASPFVVGGGVWLFEGGYHFSEDRNGRTVTEQTVPQALLRYGLNDEVELQLAWEGFTRREVGGNSSTGVTDALLGVKIQLAEDDAKVPVAFFAGLSLPTGEDGFTSDSFDPLIGAFWRYRGPLEIFGAVEVEYSDGDYNLDNGVGFFIPLSASASGYLEWEMNVPDNGGTRHSANLGVMWQTQASLQFDVNGSVGLNDRATDYGLGMGLAYRF